MSVFKNQFFDVIISSLWFKNNNTVINQDKFMNAKKNFIDVCGALNLLSYMVIGTLNLTDAAESNTAILLLSIILGLNADNFKTRLTNHNYFTLTAPTDIIDGIFVDYAAIIANPQPPQYIEFFKILEFGILNNPQTTKLIILDGNTSASPPTNGINPIDFTPLTSNTLVKSFLETSRTLIKGKFF
jgi:hypothetical protein